MEVTIKDVAKLAGVSVATISRVLNNSAVVSPETTDRVNDAIKTLNYRPNFLGRNLRKRETNVILALIPSTEHTYYSEILHGMQHTASEFGYDILMSTTNSYLQREQHLLKMLSNRTVDAAVLMGTRLDKEALDELTKYNHVALCCEALANSDILTVTIDNEKAAYDAVSYLISIGHKKIAMVSTEVRAPSSISRENGYLRALNENNIPFNEKYLFRGSYDYSSGCDALDLFMRLDEKPTAVFAVSDFLAAGVLKKTSELNIKAGRDFSVMGFDNISMADIYTPSISTIEQPCYKMGQTVSELVIENISGKKNSGKIILPHRLVLRQSTGD